MKINKLRIENLRNLVDVSVKPHQDLNFIVGDNGAGKTAILESMVVLSRGRSFRTPQASELIGPEKKSFRVFAEILNDDGKSHRLGLERTGKQWKARKDASDLEKISELTHSLPIILMEPNSHLLVSGTPEFRRKFLDWGVFHVEHSFLETWKRFSRVLKQRNSALRTGQNDILDSLDSQISPLGERLSDLRTKHKESINEELKELLPALSPELKGIELEYLNGWGSGRYEDALKEGRERDMDRGATHSGPHRADMTILKGKALARTMLSRGEQKIVSAALLLAQSKLLTSLGESPIILLDDLASEFDKVHFDNVLKEARQRGGQVWITGTNKPELNGTHKMFHVKHGILKEML